MTVDDNTLLKMFASPETKRKAFGLIVSQYSEMLYWKIRHFVLYHDDADDVMQNVLMKAWMNIDRFKADSKISTWLYSIAVNESLDFLRRKKNVADADADLYAARHLIADEYFDGDATEALLQEAIAHLPDMQRTVFLLRYYDEMKYSEMSKMLERTEGALKANYHIAAQKVLDYIKHRD